MPTPPAPLDPTLPEAALATAARHVRAVLELALEHTADQAALVVFDRQSELAVGLTEAYRRCLPGGRLLEFEPDHPEPVLAAFAALRPRDLVVLIQSTSFRLDAFRIRLELFKRSLKVIEHPHLARMPGAEALVYIDALAYDPSYYRGVGHALKRRIDRAQRVRIDSGGELLEFSAGLEPAKLNIGDYTGMPNIGGQYPIGEVFTESLELEAVAGRVRISFFGDTSFNVNRPPVPITLVVERGRVIEALDSTPEFDRVLAEIQAGDGEVWLRELGFGLNRALTQTRTVRDIGTFERMCGIHFSLGSKHATYNKPGIRKKLARFHVDVFALTETVLIDDEVVFEHGSWRA